MINVDLVLEQVLERWQRLVNSALKQDPETRELLQQFNSRQFLIHLEGVNRAVTIRFDEDQVCFSNRTPDNPDVTIRATPLTLLRFIMDKNISVGQASGSMEATGDLALAQNLRQVMSHFEMDWQGCIVKMTGDLFAFKLGQFWKYTNAGLADHLGLFSEALADYLKEESGFLLTAFESDSFVREVDDLSANIERLEARVQQISAHSWSGEC